ncbi:hypothetical protein AB0C27_26225 [Nonomuraea sp. NPDC048882]
MSVFQIDRPEWTSRVTTRLMSADLSGQADSRSLSRRLPTGVTPTRVP